MTGQSLDHVGIELTPEHPLHRLARLGERAESAGFDGCYVASHYFNRDPFAALTRIADATSEIGVGTAGANPYDTHPVALASRVATLQEASDGRALFGLGPGDASALRSLRIEQDRPLRRVLETMQTSRALFAGERVSRDGVVSAQDAGLEYEISQVPILIAAQGPHMLRMAGKYADGVLINAAHPADLAWASDRIEEGLADRTADTAGSDIIGSGGGGPDASRASGSATAGGQFEGIEIADSERVTTLAYASVSVDEDGEAARSLARRPVAFIAAGASPELLDRHDLDADRAATIGEALERGDFRDAFDAVSPAMLDALSIAGTPQTVAEQLAAVAEHVDGIVVGSPLGPDLEESVGLAAAAIEQVRS